MRLDRPNCNLRALLAAACAVSAATVSAAAGASNPPTPPTASVTIDGGRITSPVRPTTGGSLTCTKNAHYHLYVWLAQQDRGALAKGSIPAKLPPRPTKATLARARAASACTGSSQPWSVLLKSVSRQPVSFAAGAATVCAVLYAGKSHLYTLTQGCKQVTLQ